MAGKSKTNWLAIRTAYVVKGWSAARCAEEFNLHPTTIKTKAAKEEWTTERDRNATDATAVVANEIREAVQDQVNRHMIVTDRMVEITDALSAKYIEMIRTFNPEDARGFRALIECGKSLSEMTKNTIGTSRLSRGLTEGDQTVEQGNVGPETYEVEYVVREPLALETSETA